MAAGQGARFLAVTALCLHIAVVKTRTLTVRGVPDSILAVLRAAARRNRRSLNAELLTLMERATAPEAEPSLPLSPGVREPSVPPYPGAKPRRSGRKTMPRIEPTELAGVCRRFHIRSLAVFGSAARGEDSPHRDVDLLVEFEPGMTPGFAIVTVGEELAKLFRKPVDLITPRGLSAGLRKRVLAEAVPLYHA